MLCTLCNKEDVPEARLRKLGLTTCLLCAEAVASKEIAAKAKRVSLAYPKGPYMYQGAAEDAKRNLNESTDRRRATEITEIAVVRAAVANNKAVTKRAKQYPLGIYWLPGETGSTGGTVFFDDNDPNLKLAARKVYLR